MKVKELIKILEQCDPEANVYYARYMWGENGGLDEYDLDEVVTQNTEKVVFI